MTPLRIRPPYRFWQAKSEASKKANVWTWVKENSEPIKIVFAVLAGLYVLLQYKASDHLEHIKVSTDSIEQFYKSDNYASRKAARGLQSLSICAIQGRCDAPTMCMYLFHTLEDFRCNFREEIADISYANGACFIDEVDYFLDTYCKEWLITYLGLKSYNNIKDDYCMYDRDRNISFIGEMCVNSIIYKTREAFWDRFFR